MGQVPLVANDVDSGTFCPVATTRTQDIHVSDMTIETTATAAQVTTGYTVTGIRYTDCDDCTVDRVTVNEVPHAAVQFQRGNRNRGSFIHARHIGNYRHASETPISAQSCLYLWSSCGFVANDNGFTDSSCDGVASGLNIRGDDGVGRPAPFGESALNFSTGVVRISQTFKILNGSYGSTGFRPSAIWLWLRKPLAAAAITGTIDVAIFDATGGTPQNTNDVGITGYGYANWSASLPAVTQGYDSASLASDFRLVRFQRTSSAPTPLPIVGGVDTPYAIVVRYSGGASKVDLQYDDAATDTYAAGSIYTAGASGNWSAGGTGYDLNFFVENGMNYRSYFDNVTVNDVNGLGTAQGSASITSSISGSLRGIRVTRGGAIAIGSSLATSWVANNTVSGFSVVDQPVAADSPGIFFGEYGLGTQVSGGVIQGTGRTGGGNCLEFRAWARDVSITDLKASDCFNHGVYMNMGLRDISIANSSFRDVGQNGVSFSHVSSCITVDGVGCPQRNISITGSDFAQIHGAGIGKDNTDNSQQNLKIVGNRFTNLGSHFFARIGTLAGSGPYLIADNIVNGWGHGPSGSFVWAVDLYANAQPIVGFSFTGNVLISTNQGETRGIMADMVNGDDWSFVGNQVFGTLADNIAYLIYNGNTKQLVFTGNVPGTAWAAGNLILP